MAVMSNPPDPNFRKPALVCAEGAWDCHIHLFGPKPAYGLVSDAAYDTPDALPQTYIALQKALGLEHAVIVQTMVQGHDHSRLLDALRQHPGRFRGIAVPAGDVSDAQLEEMDRLGVRGIRVVVSTGLAGVGAPADAGLDRRLIARVSELGWHVQVVAGGEHLLQLKDLLPALPTEVVIDHAGLPRVELGVNHPHFQVVLELLDTGRCWVKLSAPMRFSARRRLPYDDTLPFYRELVRRAPERLVWGSDWPHVAYTEGVMPNDADLLDLLLDWAPDAALRRRILVENPSRLYGRFKESSKL
jgi:predicted TIM-barrel fold metal-dependent hydrolase